MKKWLVTIIGAGWMACFGQIAQVAITRDSNVVIADKVYVELKKGMVMDVYQVDKAEKQLLLMHNGIGFKVGMDITDFEKRFAKGTEELVRRVPQVTIMQDSLVRLSESASIELKQGMAIEVVRVGLMTKQLQVKHNGIVFVVDMGITDYEQRFVIATGGDGDKIQSRSPLLSVASRLIYLAVLQEQSIAVSGGRPFKKGKDNPYHPDHTMKVSHGLFAYAPSKIVYDIGKYSMTFLEGGAGLAEQGSCKFMIYGDGTLLWESKTMDNPKRAWNLSERFKVSVEGVKELSLVVDVADDDAYNDSYWIDPVLYSDNGVENVAKESVPKETQPNVEKQPPSDKTASRELEETQKDTREPSAASETSQVSKQATIKSSDKVYLSDLQEISACTGDSHIQKKGGERFNDHFSSYYYIHEPMPNVLFAQAPSQIVYDIGSYTMTVLEGGAGFSTGGSCKFKIYGDGKILWESKTTNNPKQASRVHEFLSCQSKESKSFL